MDLDAHVLDHIIAFIFPQEKRTISKKYVSPKVEKIFRLTTTHRFVAAVVLIKPEHNLLWEEEAYSGRGMFIGFQQEPETELVCAQCGVSPERYYGLAPDEGPPFEEGDFYKGPMLVARIKVFAECTRLPLTVDVVTLLERNLKMEPLVHVCNRCYNDYGCYEEMLTTPLRNEFNWS